MTHLTPEQLIDLVEGHAPHDAVAHVRSCEACRIHADALRDALRLAAADSVPEPSPLFWDHLAARVRAAIRQDADPRARWRTWTRGWAPIGAVAVLVVGVGLGARLWTGSPATAPAVTEPAVAGVHAPVAAETGEDLSYQSDASWSLMTALSADVASDDVMSAELPTVPGLADRALQQLSNTERAELARILREEMTRPDAPASKSAGD